MKCGLRGPPHHAEGHMEFGCACCIYERRRWELGAARADADRGRRASDVIDLDKRIGALAQAHADWEYRMVGLDRALIDARAKQQNAICRRECAEVDVVDAEERLKEAQDDVTRRTREVADAEADVAFLEAVVQRRAEERRGRS